MLSSEARAFVGQIVEIEYVDREGKTRTSLDVHADNLVLLGSRAGGPQESQGPVDNGGQGGGFNGPDKQFSPDDDDIPEQWMDEGDTPVDPETK